MSDAGPLSLPPCPRPAEARGWHRRRRAQRRLSDDFVNVQLGTGKNIRVMTVFVLALRARATSCFSYRTEDLVRALEQVCPDDYLAKAVSVDQNHLSSPATPTRGLSRMR